MFHSLDIIETINSKHWHSFDLSLYMLLYIAFFVVTDTSGAVQDVNGSCTKLWLNNSNKIMQYHPNANLPVNLWIGPKKIALSNIE